MTSRKHDGGADPAVSVAADRLRAMTEAFYALGQDFAARHGLHPTDVQALVHLIDAEQAGAAATPGSIGEALGLASGSVTALVDRLERAGHARRVRDTRDRRRVIVVPSEAMLSAGQQHWGVVDDRVVEALGRYRPAELEVVQRFLLEMTAIAADAASTPPTGAGSLASDDADIRR